MKNFYTTTELTNIDKTILCWYIQYLSWIENDYRTLCTSKHSHWTIRTQNFWVTSSLFPRCNLHQPLAFWLPNGGGKQNYRQYSIFFERFSPNFSQQTFDESTENSELFREMLKFKRYKLYAKTLSSKLRFCNYSQSFYKKNVCWFYTFPFCTNMRCTLY